VFHTSGAVDAPAARTSIEALLAAVEATVEGVTTTSPFEPAGAHQVSADRSIAYAEVAFGDVSLDVAVARAAEVTELRHRADLPAGLSVELGGEVFHEESDASSTGIGLLAAVVILLVAFGSVLAMGLPIVTALVAIGCAMAIVLLAANKLTVPPFAPAAVAMVTTGVGIDYALLLVTRYREELARGLDPESAVMRSAATAGRAVLFAGGTVVIALLGLLVIGLPSTRSLALAISAGVLMVMLASLTLVPALLGFAGKRIDRLSVRRRRPAPTGTVSVWARWSRTVQRHPGPAAAVALVVLVALSAPVLSMRLGFGDAGNRPETDTARRAHDLMAAGFGPGFNGPIVIGVGSGDSAPIETGLLERLDAALLADPGVASTTPSVVSDDGAVAVLQAFPTTGPQEAATTELVQRLRDEVGPAFAGASPVEIRVGGSVAAAADFAAVQGQRMPLFIGAVLLVSFVVLLAVFRSVTIAAKAVVLNLLSIGAAYGALVAIFQWGWGAGLLGLGQPGPIEAWAPMMLFAIVFGLSMDYEVFLLTRIREEYDRSRDTGAAVAEGMARTARLITAAATIMIVVFGAFVLSDERALQLFGFGLAIAIAVDVTVVRLLLVPAAMALLGDRNWWFPAWLDRLIPRLDVDGGDHRTGLVAAADLQRTPRLEPVPTAAAGTDRTP
jgi:putative drug exporter of the RND superfamily